MQTFSTTLNRGGQTLSTKNTANSTLADMVRNSFTAALSDTSAMISTGKGLDIEGIEYDLSNTLEDSLDNMNISKENSSTKNISSTVIKKMTGSEASTAGSSIENPLNMGDEVFDNVNHYTKYFKEPIVTLEGDITYITYGVEEVGDVNLTAGSPSLFNPYYAVKALGETRGIPLLDTTTGGTEFRPISTVDGLEMNDGAFSVKQEMIDSINDCSIKRLVEESKKPLGELGQARYKYSDFMYCADLGKLSNNHLITLRKFSSPIRDNIFKWAAHHDKDNFFEMQGDVGRMVTWFGTEDNKLEDIMKYNFTMSWKELNAKIDPKDSEEDAAERGPLGKVLNTINPAYNRSIFKGVGQGIGFTSGRLKFNLNGGQYTNNPVINGSLYDNNKVYEPKNIIPKTVTYEGKLDFNQEFTLVFKYKLRSYDGINPKSAFLDLLGNILSVTYKDGTFWPGQRRLIGPPQNKSGWNKAMAFLDKSYNDTSLFVNKMINGAGDENALNGIKGLLGNIAGNFSEAIAGGVIGDVLGAAKNFVTGKSSGVEMLKNFAKAGQKAEIGKNLMGGLKNTLGRPAVYAFDSLLSGDAVGLWHVTIGNPLNPIAAFGNLIITNTEIQHSGPLGFDDFPSELKVSVTLKHATPRDMVDIGKMYTRGESALYIPLPNNKYNLDSIEQAENKYFEQYKGIKKSSNKELASGEDVKYVDDSSILKRFTNSVTKFIKTDDIGAYEEYVGWYGDWHPQRIQTNRDQIRI